MRSITQGIHDSPKKSSQARHAGILGRDDLPNRPQSARLLDTAKYACQLPLSLPSSNYFEQLLCTPAGEIFAIKGLIEDEAFVPKLGRETQPCATAE